MGWQPVVGYLVQTVLVIAIVQYLKNFGMSWLKANAPWSLPAIAMFAAQGLGLLATFLGGFLGYPIDFSAIAAVLVGTSAIAVYDVKHGMTKAKN